MLRIVLQLRIMLANSRPGVGLSWDLNPGGSGSESVLIKGAENVTKLQKYVSKNDALFTF